LNCAWAQSRLFDYLDGLLDATASERIKKHLNGCRECASFAAALESPVDDAEDLTQAVLRGTGCAACDQSLERLPDWIDGAIATVDAELLAGHVTHCAECQAIAGVLRAMETDLPELAEVRPDERFLDDVMAATARKAPALVWSARFDRWLGDLLRRPRIAWEGAYVASVFLALLVGLPGSPLAVVSQKALELVRTDPDKIEEPFVVLEVELNNAANEAWSSTRKVARSLAVKAAAGTSDVFRKAKQDVGTLWTSLASDPVNGQTEKQEEQTSTNGENK
jgi:anti-sigma factor RsiW